MAYNCENFFDPCGDNCVLPANRYSCAGTRRFGPVKKVLIACQNQPLVTVFPAMDESDPLVLDQFSTDLNAELLARINNGETDFVTNPDTIREWKVEAPFPTSENEEVAKSACYPKLVTNRTFTLAAVVKDLSQSNIIFGRTTQSAGNFPVKLWYLDQGYIWGGQDGIDGTFTDFLYAADGLENNSEHTGTFTFEWDSLCLPPVHPSGISNVCDLLVDDLQAAA